MWVFLSRSNWQLLVPEFVCFVLLIGLQVDGDMAFLEQRGLRVLQGTGASSPVTKAPGTPVGKKKKLYHKGKRAPG